MTTVFAHEDADVRANAIGARLPVTSAAMAQLGASFRQVVFVRAAQLAAAA